MDRKAVGDYIDSDLEQFKRLAVNRVQLVQGNTNGKEWYHLDMVDTLSNYISQNLDVFQKKQVGRSFQGPEFLWNSESTWPMHNTDLEVDTDDTEVIKQANISF